MVAVERIVAHTLVPTRVQPSALQFFTDRVCVVGIEPPTNVVHHTRWALLRWCSAVPDNDVTLILPDSQSRLTALGIVRCDFPTQ